MERGNERGGGVELNGKWVEENGRRLMMRGGRYYCAQTERWSA